MIYNSISIRTLTTDFFISIHQVIKQLLLQQGGYGTMRISLMDQTAKIILSPNILLLQTPPPPHQFDFTPPPNSTSRSQMYDKRTEVERLFYELEKDMPYMVKLMRTGGLG